MNAKTEFNRCVLPGVSRKVTEGDKKEAEEWRIKILERKKRYQREKHPGAEQPGALVETEPGDAADTGAEQPGALLTSTVGTANRDCTSPCPLGGIEVRPEVKTIPMQTNCYKNLEPSSHSTIDDPGDTTKETGNWDIRTVATS